MPDFQLVSEFQPAGDQPRAITSLVRDVREGKGSDAKDSTIALARTFSGSDFKDNLQIAVAVENGMDAIVTRDPAGFAGAPIPVVTPNQLLASLGVSSRATPSSWHTIGRPRYNSRSLPLRRVLGEQFFAREPAPDFEPGMTTDRRF